MSPGMSQKGIRRPSRSPVRAGTRGKKALVPRTEQTGPPSHASVWADCMVMPASMKASPVPDRSGQALGAEAEPQAGGERPVELRGVGAEPAPADVPR